MNKGYAIDKSSCNDCNKQLRQEYERVMKSYFSGSLEITEVYRRLRSNVSINSYGKYEGHERALIIANHPYFHQDLWIPSGELANVRGEKIFEQLHIPVLIHMMVKDVILGEVISFVSPIGFSKMQRDMNAFELPELKKLDYMIEKGKEETGHILIYPEGKYKGEKNHSGAFVVAKELGIKKIVLVATNDILSLFHKNSITIVDTIDFKGNIGEVMNAGMKRIHDYVFNNFS